MSRSIADLKRGETGIIKSLTDRLISHKLLEMGCLPGREVQVLALAPFGDPVCISIGGGYHLALRQSEARSILVESPL